MDCCLNLLLGYLAVVWVVLSVWTVLDSVHTARCQACRTAREAVREWNPGWRVSGSSHRATEPERDVVAVFSQAPLTRTHPTPYVLVAVGRSGAVVGLPLEANLQYALMPRK